MNYSKACLSKKARFARISCVEDSASGSATESTPALPESDVYDPE